MLAVFKTAATYESLMKFQRCCHALSAVLLSACGQAGPLVLPDKTVSAPPPAAASTAVVPTPHGLDTPATKPPAEKQNPKKEQP